MTLHSPRAPQRPPRPRHARPTPHPTRAALSGLSALPVRCAANLDGLFWVRGQPGTPARGLLLSVHARDLSALARELPGHLAAPEAYRLNLRRAHNAAYAGGYLAARRACLPHTGPFTSVTALDLSALPHAYRGCEALAFQEGARAYRLVVERHTPPTARGDGAAQEAA